MKQSEILFKTAEELIGQSVDWTLADGTDVVYTIKEVNVLSNGDAAIIFNERPTTVYVVKTFS